MLMRRKRPEKFSHGFRCFSDRSVLNRPRPPDAASHELERASRIDLLTLEHGPPAASESLPLLQASACRSAAAAAHGAKTKAAQNSPVSSSR